MLMGEIVGKTTPKEFSFKLFQDDVKRHDFVVVKDQNNQWLLAQIEDVETLPEGDIIAHAKMIGYRSQGIIVSPRTPIKPGTLVYKANKEILGEVLGFDSNGLYVGLLENNEEVKVYLDLEHLISKHLAVLATTGSGKSYTVGVILEELLERDVPVVVIDPHGEYSSMRFPNDSPKNKELFKIFEVQPRGYTVNEYSPDTKINPSAQKLAFEDKNLDPQDIIQMLPAKPTSSQIGLIYSAIKDLKDRKEDYTLEDIINEISNMESNAKWNIINMLDVIRTMGIFSKKGTDLRDLVKRGTLTVINLKGVSVDIQQLVVQRIVKELFDKRKLGKIPPFFLIIEEAHNYVPEKEVTYASKIIRTVASEGRKFGMGLGVVSQRPARVDKNILSQCNTQIILRITNPNDLKAVTYAEYAFEDLDKEIKNLPIGHALIIGKEVPLFVKIRVRKSKHGGETVSIRGDFEDTITIINPMTPYTYDLTGYEKLYYPFYYVKLKSGSAYLIDAIKGKQLYFKEGHALETEPLDLEKNVFLSFSKKERSGRVLEPKITKEILEQTMKDIVESIELIYYPYYIRGNEFVDGVLGIRKER